LIKKGQFKEIYGNTILKLPKLKISIIGSSFGGSVALCCSSLKVDSIIAICPVINFKAINKDLLNLKRFLKEAYGNCYRFNDLKFTKLINSEILSPTNYIKTPVLLIQGLQDKTINPNSVTSFYKSITNKNKKLIIIKNGGHLSTSDLSSNLSRVYTWLNSLQ
jgi:esterase/lipase